MSLETKTRIICDGCGAFVDGKLSYLATRIGESYWDAKTKANSDGWMVAERSYRRDVHYCRNCADTPQKPIGNPERPKKCQECRDITKADKSETGRKMNMGWTRCPNCNWRRTIWKRTA